MFGHFCVMWIMRTADRAIIETAEIQQLLQATPERFSPPFVVLFEWYLQAMVN